MFNGRATRGILLLHQGFATDSAVTSLRYIFFSVYNTLSEDVILVSCQCNQVWFCTWFCKIGQAAVFSI